MAAKPPPTIADVLIEESAKLTPLAARFGQLAERAKASATTENDARLWVVSTSFSSAAWMLICAHNLLHDAARVVRG